MLPLQIQPYIINIVNTSPTLAYPVTILGAYETLAYTNINSNLTLFTYTQISPDANTFQYVDASGNTQLFTISNVPPINPIFQYIGLNLATFLSGSGTYSIVGFAQLPSPTTPTFYQNNNNIQISMNSDLGVTYAQFLEQSISNPFKVSNMYIKTNNYLQIEQDANDVIINHKDIDGDDAKITIKPFINPYQSSLEGVITDTDFMIDGFTNVQIFQLLPLTTMEIFFYPKKVIKEKLNKNTKFIDTTKDDILFKQKELFQKNKKFKKYVAEKELQIFSTKDKDIVIGLKKKLLSEKEKFKSFIEQEKKKLK